MPRNKVNQTGREKGEIAGYVRFALNEEELALLDAACKLEEHCRADLARIYTMRYCRAIVAQFQQKEVMDEAHGMMSWLQKAISNDVSTDSQARKKK